MTVGFESLGLRLRSVIQCPVVSNVGIMVPSFISYLQTLWPFSPHRLDDLGVSDRIVRGLPIPEQTKQFVFAIPEPESQSIVYILAAQNLSKQAAVDAECLIKEVRPEVVVAQVTPSVLVEILEEDSKSSNNLVNSMPTTSFEVLKGCFINKINKEIYENVAGNLVFQEIFGVGFHGHHLSAKRAAEDVGSSFLLLEAPSMNAEGDSCGEPTIRNKFQALVLQQCSLVPQKVSSVSPKTFCVTNDLQHQMVRSICSYLAQSASKVAPSTSVSEVDIGEFQPRCNYLVEGLRIALNNAARCPVSKLPGSARIEFSELPVNDKSHVLLAQTLRSQTKNFKTIVAIVEASSLAAAIALGKSFGPSKLVGHGIASYGAKSTSVLKAAASAQKIRAVAHNLIASAERIQFFNNADCIL
ncbi:hypothetical protein F0562_017611 [Nyssa sinensis]|uniref:Uncharacterized protein n=1 Tax=Nyssa sinensis TaxID=561372 RepID=A0A5J4ZIC8_9ASTE|nr:hypothetical protein F0562_017611 [Nyssa sinensis]